MNKNYQKRKTIFLAVGDINWDSIPSDSVQLILLEGKSPVDVGALAYCEREQRLRIGKRPESLRVVQKSLRSSRIQPLRRWIEAIQVDHVRGVKANTLKAKINLVFQFVDWCDANNSQNLMDSSSAGRDALEKYILSLIHRVRLGSLGTHTASNLQFAAIDFLMIALDEKNNKIIAGLPHLSTSSLAKLNPTPPPDSDVADRALGLYKALFRQFSDFVLENKKYPIQIELPRFSAWMFPAPKGIVSPEELAKRNSWNHPYSAYDYANGKVFEVGCLYKAQRDIHNEKILVKNAHELIARANKDSRHPDRVRRAALAHDAFVMWFIAVTGANVSSVRALLWADDFTIQKEYQGFRAIKYRANGRLCEFYITSKFLPEFKKFLKLRDYLLAGKKSTWLFFSLGRSFRAEPEPISPNFSTKFFYICRRIDPLIEQVGGRQWRSHKSDYLVRNADPATAALLLQNSEKTVLKHYVAGSEKSAAKEMTSFYEDFKKRVLAEKLESKVTTPIGGCRNFNSPTKDLTSNGIDSDCTQFEGCLFCENYSVSADATDVRKLLSYVEILKQTMPLSKSEEHFNSVFGEAISRIKVIIEAIKKVSYGHEEMVSRIALEVNAGDLDPYWGHKMDMMISVGMING